MGRFVGVMAPCVNFSWRDLDSFRFSVRTSRTRLKSFVIVASLDWSETTTPLEWDTLKYNQTINEVKKVVRNVTMYHNCSNKILGYGYKTTPKWNNFTQNLKQVEEEAKNNKNCVKSHWSFEKPKWLNISRGFFLSQYFEGFITLVGREYKKSSLIDIFSLDFMYLVCVFFVSFALRE